MTTIRRATIEDLIEMQNTNLLCLPENYTLKYYLYHGVCFPHCLHVAETDTGKIVGYVLAKIDDDEGGKELGGHITSISILRSYRRLGIATKLMRAALESMQKVYDADAVSLNVRVSNRAALGLYEDVLGFTRAKVEQEYYADGENAFEMKKYFKPEKMPENFLKKLGAGKDKGAEEKKGETTAESDTKAGGAEEEKAGEGEEKEEEEEKGDAKKKKRKRKKRH